MTSGHVLIKILQRRWQWQIVVLLLRPARPTLIRLLISDIVDLGLWLAHQIVTIFFVFTPAPFSRGGRFNLNFLHRTSGFGTILLRVFLFFQKQEFSRFPCTQQMLLRCVAASSTIPCHRKTLLCACLPDAICPALFATAGAVCCATPDWQFN